MPHPPMWRRYLRFRGTDVHADVDAELGHHMEALVDQLIREGRNPAVARTEAERRFGDYQRVQAACVEIDRSWERQKRWQLLLTDLWQDLRFGARTLLKEPGFTISVVVVLGLGLGAAITMATAINAIFVRQLPFPEPDRVVGVVRHLRSGMTDAHSPALVAFLRDHSQSFSALASIGVSPGVNLTSESGSRHIRDLRVSAGYFEVLGVEPQLGRVFSRDDENGWPTVVLSHTLWVANFQANPHVIGADLRLGGRTHTVIGVMPPEFWSFEEADLWTPFHPDPGGAGQNYRLIGRLAPASTAAQADAELQALAITLDAESTFGSALPNLPRQPVRLGTRPYRDLLSAGTAATVWPLTAAVSLMLLVVCANAAGLQMARTMGSRRELAVRSALGGGRGRLFRQLLTESVLLAMAGAAVGVLVATAGVRGLTAMQPGLEVWNIDIDAMVMLGSVGLALATGVIFGLIPGLLAVRSAPANPLCGGQSHVGARPLVGWIRRSLVVAQIALCTLLVVVAGVFLRTFLGLNTSELGFDPTNVLTARASLQGPAYGSGDAVSALFRRTLGDGVDASSVRHLNVPRWMCRNTTHLEEEASNGRSYHHRHRSGEAEFSASWFPCRWVGCVPQEAEPGESVGLAGVAAALRGGDGGLCECALLGPRDRQAGSRGEAGSAGLREAVRQAAEERRVGRGGDLRGGLASDDALCSGEDRGAAVSGHAVPHARTAGSPAHADDQRAAWTLGRVWCGVATTRPTVFVPVEQVPDDLLALVHGYTQVNWALRTQDETAGLIQSVAQVIQEADPLLSITAFRTMDEVLGQSLDATRSRTLLLGLFAAASLTLAAAGLYGLVRYTVVQRTKEIGIRMALGAADRQVTAEFARKGILLAAVGAIVGVGAAALLLQVLRGVTPTVEPLDAWVVAAVMLVLGAASVGAAVVPARRAGRIDPALALRAK